MSATVKITEEQLISKLEELPTLPSVVHELLQVINNPMASTGDIEKIMANDPSLTIKVLKLVNSAYYSIPGGVTSLSRAIAYIGFDTVNQLVLSASVLDSLKFQQSGTFKISEFWKHCIGVGIASETIAQHIRHPNPSEVFTCGLLHDMGKVATLMIAPDVFLETAKYAEIKHKTFAESEVELGHPKHTHIGSVLAEKWNLPEKIQACIKYHHETDAAHRVGLSNEAHRAVDVVCLANLLTHALKFGNSGHSKILGAPRDVLERLGMNPDRDLKPLLLKIRTNHDKATEFLRVL